MTQCNQGSTSGTVMWYCLLSWTWWFYFYLRGLNPSLRPFKTMLLRSTFMWYNCFPVVHEFEGHLIFMSDHSDKRRLSTSFISCFIDLLSSSVTLCFGGHNPSRWALFNAIQIDKSLSLTEVAISKQLFDSVTNIIHPPKVKTRIECGRQE